MGDLAVDQVVHIGEHAYRVTEVDHAETGIWTYTLVPEDADGRDWAAP